MRQVPVIVLRYIPAVAFPSLTFPLKFLCPFCFTFLIPNVLVARWQGGMARSNSIFNPPQPIAHRRSRSTMPRAEARWRTHTDQFALRSESHRSEYLQFLITFHGHNCQHRTSPPPRVRRRRLGDAFCDWD